MKKHVFHLAILLLAWLLMASEPNEKYPQNYFRSPLPDDVPLILAGTFGELRSNHFHAGLDLKTKGTTGMKLHAVANGYVSRIKIATGGYGTALYVDHPNGYTSVYAHLSGFNEKIDKFITQVQREKETWEIEIYPGKNELLVKKGELIAISGNSGASRAPHLHFEIRESRTQIPVDPLLCGFEIIDNRRPRIYRFQVHPYGKNSAARVVYTNGRSITRTSRPIVTRVSGRGGRYGLYPVREIQAFGKVGFSISAYDYHDGSFNKLGVPIMRIKVNDELVFMHDIEKVPFSKTRYLNAFIDYEAKHRQGRYYYRNHILPGNGLNIYPKRDNDGFFDLKEDTTLKIEYELRDRNGNSTWLNFNLKGLEKNPYSSSTIGPETKRVFHYDERNTFETEDLKLAFPKGSFYEDIEFKYDDKGVSNKGYSNIHVLHDNYTPLHKHFKISMRAKNLPKRLEEKVLITRYGRSLGGKFENGFVTTRSKYFGKFYLNVDTVAPYIRPYNIYNGKNMYRNSTILVRISDNLSGISRYKAYIDDKFIIMSHDYKKRMLTYHFPKNFENGEHEFKLVVYDRKENHSSITYKFRR